MSFPPLVEFVLPAAYPVLAGALYWADGELILAPYDGSAEQLARHVGARQIRRCDTFGRRLFC